MKKIGHNS